MREIPSAIVKEGTSLLGRHEGLFERANLLDVKRLWHYEVPRWVKTWRLKEWRAFFVSSGRWSFAMALYNAKLCTVAYFSAWDRGSGKSYGFRRVVPGSLSNMGERLPQSRSSYHGQHARLDFEYDLAKGVVRIMANWRPGHGERGFHARFVLNSKDDSWAPVSVVLPLGRQRVRYSARAILGAEGDFDTADGKFHIDAETSVAMLADHKGFYPFGMQYDWVGGVGLDSEGAMAGFSLTSASPREQGDGGENTLWIGGKSWGLPAVRITRATGYQGDWVIQDMEGLVDLVFTPKAHNDVNFHLGVFESDWHGPFGSFRGFVRNRQGMTLQADGISGLGEDQYIRI